MQRFLGLAHQQLVGAGFPGGLSAPELLATMVLSSGAALIVLWLVPGVAEHPLGWALPPLGALAPVLLVNERRGERVRALTRELPAVLDLAALCMAAGLSFPSAIELIASQCPRSSATRQALEQVLIDMRLGRTQQQALSDLAASFPADVVLQFVRAVTEASRRGAPIAEVLATQAEGARRQRSVRAEERAARAGVMLTMPLMMLVGCILILLVGPLLCAGLGL
jgi:tight adherence protein C